jgi:hypothetical protein
MDTLNYIANSVKSSEVITEFEGDFLEVEYRFQELQFSVSDQLASDGYIAIGLYAGREHDTNAHAIEREFTAKTQRGAVRIIKREANAWLNRYAGWDD